MKQGSMSTEQRDMHFMRKAFMQARLALKHEEVPIGAVVVDRLGVIIGRGRNCAEERGCQTGHAEVRAIEAACRKRGDWRLDGCTIYISLEPCLMCFGLISLSRLQAVVYAAPSPLFGCGLDNPESFRLYKKHLVIRQGIAKEESVALLRQFFQKRRTRKSKEEV